MLNTFPRNFAPTDPPIGLRWRTALAGSVTAVCVCAAAPALANGGPWRVERHEVLRPGVTPADVQPHQEVRVVAADGTSLTVYAGLSAVGLEKRLVQRAAPKVAMMDRVKGAAGRVAVVTVAVGVAGFGVGMAGAGTVLSLVGWLAKDSLPADPPLLRNAVGEGLFLLLAGVAAGAAGCFAVVVAAIPLALQLAAGPPAAEPGAVAALGSSLAWDVAEAEEVVALHNGTPAQVAVASEAASEEAEQGDEADDAEDAAPEAPGSAVNAAPAGIPPPPPPPSKKTHRKRSKRGRRAR